MWKQKGHKKEKVRIETWCKATMMLMATGWMKTHLIITKMAARVLTGKGWR